MRLARKFQSQTYPTSTTSRLASHSLRQRFACCRMQLSSLEVVSRNVGLTSKLCYDVVMHTTPDKFKVCQVWGRGQKTSNFCLFDGSAFYLFGTGYGTVQDDHLSGKPGNVREFKTCHGNVRGKILSGKSVPKLFITC